MHRTEKEAEKRRKETARTASQKKDVHLLIKGVNKDLPDSRFAYIVYHAIKNISRDVSVVANKSEAVNAESVSRGTSERPRKK